MYGDEWKAKMLAEARALAAVARAEFKNNQGLGGDGVGGAAAAELLAPEAAALRWFLLPAEAAAKLRGTEPAVDLLEKVRFHSFQGLGSFLADLLLS